MKQPAARALPLRWTGFVVTVTFVSFILLAFIITAMRSSAAGSISLTMLGSPVTENFDTLVNTGTSSTVPTGWDFSEAGTNANTTYTAGTGSSTTGDTYSFGATSSSDRAFGGLQSGSLIPTIGASFTNNTGSTITSLAIAYTGEEWRLGAAGRTDRLDFQYSLNATSLTTGTWTDVDQLDFTTPDTATTGAKDGNSAAERTAVSFTITGLGIANGGTFWIRWNDFNPSGSDDGLAVDDFSLTPLGGGGTILAINDVSLAEGNGGTSTMTFTVSLSQAAGPGGVTFDIATQDNTATVADSDYVARSLTGQTIPEGSQNYTFDVTINGDANTEPNETFFVNVTNVSGATVGDGQGTGTIVNDDVASTPIYTIQGSGNASPFAGSSVTTTGIVTAVKSNGFFLQDPAGDANADTSDGVFVFTAGGTPAAAAVGNSVIVSGTVQEFIPSADPNSPPVTEIISPSVTLLSTGNPLPTAVTITAADTLVNNVNNLERLEGMRVHVDSLTAIAPNQGTITEASATATNNGVFYAVVTGVARPFREPGIATPDPVLACGSPPCMIPVFDANPERLRADSDGQTGAALLEITTGATLANVTGVLDYAFRTYTILPDPGNQTQAGVVGNLAGAIPVPIPAANEFTVASFNMERFFDTVNDGNGAPTLTATAFNNRLNKASLVIRNVMRSPDIIGVEEMENLTTLQTVATKVNTDTVAGGGADPMYQAYLVEGNDVGGIDVGFLVKSTRVSVIDVTQFGKDTTYINPNNGQPELLNDRPPLVLRALINMPPAPAFGVTVIVNHLRSLSGVDDPADGNRVRTKRRAQAEYLANLIQARQVADPSERIISVGDYNAFDVNDGYVDSMGTIKGTPAPANEVVLASSDLVNPDLVDLLGQLPANERYSFSFDGNAQTLDHELVNPNMFALFSRMAYARNDADFPLHYYEDPNRPERISDHDMAVSYFFPATPTAAKLDRFEAARYGDQVLLQWQTGEEVDNLGFNLYREVSGGRLRINPQIIAGSALVAGPGTTLTAGRSYSWWDAAAPGKPDVRYWLEEIDLDGNSRWHGPVKIKFADGKRSAIKERQSVLLSMLGREQTQESPTRPVEPAAEAVELAAAQLQSNVNLGAQPAVKISVNHEGWYRVTQPELVRAGMDPKVDPQRLQLYVDGREQPLFITAKSGADFGPADTIEFYGVGLDTASTNARVYWLVSGTQPGLRIQRVPGSGPPSAAASFACTAERKDRTVYFASLRNGDRENFFGAVITRTPIDQTLTLQHLAVQSADSATLEVALQGVTAGAHRVKILLNGSAVGDAMFDGQNAHTARLPIPQALLREGENVVNLAASGGQSDISLVDTIRVTYAHRFTADNNALRLTVASREQVTIDGFTASAIRVFDVTDADAAQEIVGAVKPQKNGFAVTVAAAGSGLRTLLAITSDQAQRPSSVAANLQSNWRQPNQSADLVIVTHRSLLESARQLQAYRESQGLRVALVDIEDIYDEFSFGNKSAYAVREFLAYAKTRWHLPPRFVLLLGDASLDPKNYLGRGDFDLVPTKLLDTQLMETASDDWLADFTGSGLAEMAVGRLPVRGADEASRMIAKVINYERAAIADSALIVSDSNDGFNFENASDQLRGLIPAGINVEQIDRGQLGTAAAKQALLDGLQRGQRIVNYLGHGSVDQWRDNLLTSAEARGLTNGDRLPLFVAMTCLNGYFQDTSLDSLAESLMKADRGGAIAVWASSGMTLPEGQSMMNRQLYRLMFDASSARGRSLGEATLRAKSSISDADVRRTWILFGDPTTPLR